jgi:hypothetical protein
MVRAVGARRRRKNRRIVDARRRSRWPIFVGAFLCGIAAWAAGRFWAAQEVDRRLKAEPVCQGPLPASPLLETAVVAMEDGRFRSHYGVDWSSVWTAALRNAGEGRVVMGGSTITQQLAKNLFLGFERTWSRKLREYFLAIELESRWPKEKILGCYLDVVDFGYGAYGAGQAARTYFDTTPGRLSKPQALFLAASLRLPPRNSSGLERAARDRGLAAARLKFWMPDEAGWDEAAKEPLSFPGLSPAKGSER